MNKNLLLQKYILFDMLASLIVWLLFVFFRKTVNDIQIFEGGFVFIPYAYYFRSLLLFPFCCVFVHFLSGFYLNPVKNTRINLFFSTLASSVIISIAVFFILKLGDVIVSYRYFYYSLLVLFGLLFTLTYLFREFIYSQVMHNYKTNKWTTNTLIIGTGTNAFKIASDLQRYANQNTLIGFISTNKQLNVPIEKVLGNLSHIASVIERYNIQEAIVAIDSDADEKQLFKIINSLFKYNIDIQFTPRLYEILTGSARIGKLGIIPLVSITNSSMPDWEASVKRFLDIVMSAFALVLLSPMLLYFIIQIKRDSNGSAFYQQERIGQYGRAFNIYKFRTMFLGAEKGKPQLSSANDCRVTPVGRILRKYRIDEIPQFWNILKGDMSLVGPRPERRFYINQIIEDAPYYCLLYKIKPGLTSWGPIKIGYSDTIEKMIERLNFDIIYMDNMSLVIDLKILIYTFEIIFKGKGV